MKKVQVFDPALCCSTRVCGVDVSQKQTKVLLGTLA